MGEASTAFEEARMRAAWRGVSARPSVFGRWLAGALALGVTLVTGPTLGAQARPRGRAAVAVGDTGARTGPPSAREELDVALRTALASHPSVTLSADRDHARFVVTGSVVELSERDLAPDEREVRCRVSIVVADARGGSVRAMLEGRAGVRGGGRGDALRQSALRGAVASALRSIDQVR
ncbi:MAG: hypothetical protein OHK0013_24760 [Sandaracinaceae bacterium]